MKVSRVKILADRKVWFAETMPQIKKEAEAQGMKFIFPDQELLGDLIVCDGCNGLIETEMVNIWDQNNESYCETCWNLYHKKAL